MFFRLFFLSALLLSMLSCAGISTEQTPVAPHQATAEKSDRQPSAKDVVPAAVPTDLGELLIIGEVEYVYIGEDTIRLPARIDTGAKTSSLGAKEIKRYESDGKKWVRFQIAAPGSDTVIDFKRPLSRTVEIKRHGVETQKRFVVRLPIKLGRISREIEFTLADRSDFEFPVLIGRNFLKGYALVDVNRKYVISPLVEN